MASFSDTTGPAVEPDITELLGELAWSDDVTDIGDCYQKQDFPQIVKLHKQEGSGPASVDKPFVLYSGKRCSKVLAANVYWEDSKQAYVDVGPRVVIPDNFPGWFWFLQDFARVGKTYASVAELAKSRPSSFLVRRAVPAFRFSENRDENGDRVFISQHVPAGQVLAFGDIYTETVTSSSKSSCCLIAMFDKAFLQRSEEKHYLQCKDGNGKDVLLEFCQVGEFLAIGEPGSALQDAVYELKDIIKHVQLPVLIKLSYGQPPTTPCSFTGLLKLEEQYTEDTIIACRMGTKSPVMAEFPISSKIGFITANNSKDFLGHDEVKRAIKHCDDTIETYLASIKVVQNLFPCTTNNTIKAGRVQVKSYEGAQVKSLEVQSDHDSMNTMTTGDFTDDDFEDYDEDTLQGCDEANFEHYPDNAGNSCPLPMHRDDTLEESQYEVIHENVPEAYQPIESVNLYASPAHGYIIEQFSQPVVQQSEILLEVNNLSNLDDNLLRQQLRISNVDESPSFEEFTGYDNYGPAYEVQYLQDYNQDEIETNIDDILDDNHNLALGIVADDHMDTFLSDSVNSLGQLNLESIEDDLSSLIAPPPPPVVKDVETEEVDDFLKKVIQSATLKRNSKQDSFQHSCSYEGQETPRSRPTPLRFSSIHDESTPIKSKILQPLGLHIAYHDNLAFSPQEDGDVLGNDSFRSPFVGGLNRNSVFKPIRPGSAASSYLSDQQVPLSPGSSQPTASTPSPDREMQEMLAQRTDSGIFILPSHYSDTWPDSDSPNHSPSDDLWTPPDKVDTMSVASVLQSLRYIGMKPHVVRQFQDEQIDGKQLLELDDTLLREGFPELNALERKKIRDFVSGWRPKK